MQILFFCKKCEGAVQRRIEALPAHEGQTLECPKCGEMVNQGEWVEEPEKLTLLARIMIAVKRLWKR